MTREEACRQRSAELENDIRQHIMERTGRRVRGLEVKVVCDHIVIRGQTASFHLKQLALQGLLEVIGTVGPIRIEHDIRVEGKRPEPEPEGV
ncbi:MAG TPA: hypothetical protein VKD72_11045 [Gemmataceae bacterium]|nr:hypothetical protein [Gemmataceae bacterium]